MVLDPSDQPILGAENIGRAIGIIGGPGSGARTHAQQVRHAFSICEKLLREGVISKLGGTYAATPRALRERFSGKAA
jgi:hypothetical protein